MGLILTFIFHQILFIATVFLPHHSRAFSRMSDINHSRNAMNNFLSANPIGKALPEKLIVGYCNWNQCDESIIKAVVDGVNVVIWFSINLVDGPNVQNGPDMDCVASIVERLHDMQFDDVVHLISIGGWNSPHPSTTSKAEEVFGKARLAI